MSTPPSLAISGKTWPGRTKSLAPMLRFASALTVLQRCSAEMPVVMPCLTSTEMVKAVPSGASFAATMGGRFNRLASAAVRGAQTMPQPLRMMNAIFSVVQSEAATIMSPSFSRSSSSVTTTISPRANASMASVTGLPISCPFRAVGGLRRKSFGVTAPPVSATMRSAVSRDSQAPSSRQISVTAPAETPMRRANSARETP